MMLVASLPPQKAGGAELQSLLLANELRNHNVHPWFVCPGTTAIKGESTLQSNNVSRPYSLLTYLFEKLAILRKKSTPKEVRIEYNDTEEVTNKIISRVSWPTLIYMQIFYLHCILFLQKKISEVHLIHAHTMEWTAIIALRLGKRYGKPVLIKDSTMNGFESLARFPHGEKWQRELQRNAWFIAMTDAILQNLSKGGVPASKIFKIPNGIRIDGKSMQRGLRNENQVVLFVGNLYQQPAKGIDILLKAWKKVVAKFPSVQLRVVGDGDLDKYVAYATQLKINSNVQFLGKRTDLDNLYDEADIFVLPSRREGMSNSLLEAMMRGLPTVATNISGSQDIVTHRLNGLLVPPGDVDALASALGELLSNPALAVQFGEAGKVTIARNYNIEKIATEYVNAYQQILEQPQ